MRFSLREAALDLDSVCVIERLRIENLDAQAQRLFREGYLENRPDSGLQGLRDRLVRLKRIAWFVRVLADHEDRVRALDPRLSVPLSEQGPDPVTSS